MKYLHLSGLLLAFVACQSSENQSVSGDQFTVKMDTVMIHPENEILYLNSSLYTAKLSPDKKYLYNFNYKEYAIEMIDLDELKFVSKITLDKEGPNGVGDNFMGLEIIDVDRFLINSFRKDNIVDQQGKKIAQFDFAKIGKGQDGLEERDNMQIPLSISADGNRFAGLVTNWENKTAKLVVVDLDQNQLKKFPAPEIEKASKFEIMLNDGEMRMFLDSRRYGAKEGGKIIYGTAVSHELYVLEPETEEFRLVNYASDFLPPEKTGDYPSEVSSKNEMRTIYEKIQTDINYLYTICKKRTIAIFAFLFVKIFILSFPAKN
ncbi:MAG: DUF4221 family protein [Cyclobacteriaceae bacterium]